MGRHLGTGAVNVERAQEIVSQLTGSCQDVQSALHDGEDEYDPVLVEVLDDNIFNCAVCGWWCENEEMSDDEDGPKCNDCAEDESRA